NTLFPGGWLPDTKKSQRNDSTILSFEAMQKQHIIKALRKTNGKVSGKGGAAEILQLKDKTLFAKMKKLGIEKKMIFE
ncbi:MAG: Fis family transcriptional regulator, partial [Bacteroidota bacterium]